LKDFLLPQPFTQLACCRTVAAKAKRANVFEIALPSPFRHRLNMVGVPKALATVLLESPKPQQRLTGIATRTPQPPIGCYSISSAGCTDASITQQHLFPQVGRLRTQLPLVNAIF
jgi:hypothetical protein